MAEDAFFVDASQSDVYRWIRDWGAGQPEPVWVHVVGGALWRGQSNTLLLERAAPDQVPGVTLVPVRRRPPRIQLLRTPPRRRTARGRYVLAAAEPVEPGNEALVATLFAALAQVYGAEAARSSGPKRPRAPLERRADWEAKQEKVMQYQELRREGVEAKEAARRVGVHRNTLDGWAKRMQSLAAGEES